MVPRPDRERCQPFDYGVVVHGDNRCPAYVEQAQQLVRPPVNSVRSREGLPLCFEQDLADGNRHPRKQCWPFVVLGQLKWGWSTAIRESHPSKSTLPRCSSSTWVALGPSMTLRSSSINGCVDDACSFSTSWSTCSASWESTGNALLTAFENPAPKMTTSPDRFAIRPVCHGSSRSWRSQCPSRCAANVTSLTSPNWAGSTTTSRVPALPRPM